MRVSIIAPVAIGTQGRRRRASWELGQFFPGQELEREAIERLSSALEPRERAV